MPNERFYACTHVLSGDRPVLYVCREDGDLILACGSGDHEQSTHDWKVVHPGHVVDRDTSLAEVIDLRDNEQAERSADSGRWTRSPITD